MLGITVWNLEKENFDPNVKFNELLQLVEGTSKAAATAEEFSRYFKRHFCHRRRWPKDLHQKRSLGELGGLGSFVALFCEPLVPCSYSLWAVVGQLSFKPQLGGNLFLLQLMEERRTYFPRPTDLLGHS